MKALPIEPRFLAKVRKTETCWLWLGCVNTSGYGTMSVKNTPTYAHRVSYELYKGEVGEAHVMHTCDNPLCVNPEHLQLGTRSDNMQDCYKKNRHPIVKISYEQATEIRKLYATGQYTQGALGKLYGVSYRTIGYIVNYERRL